MMKAFAVAGLLTMIAVSRVQAQEPPTEWIDADTGHRVVRLSREPGSESLYFHQNALSPDGKKIIFTSPTGISTVDLESREITKIVEGTVRPIVTGRKSGDVYYIKDRVVYASSLDGKSNRKIIELSPGMAITTINADETLLGGSITHGEPADQPNPAATQPISRAERIANRFAQHLLMELIFVDIKTGEVRKANPSNDWQNHIQFSPTDPTLLMFCHEGPWHKVDRIWTIRSDGSNLTKVHARTQTMEIAGHEFFSGDGRTIWYDLQTPKGESFWVAGLNLDTNQRTKYHLLRNEWSVHFNVSNDGTLFAGDGGSSKMVARAPDGQWIYLFRPRIIEDRGGPEIDSAPLIRSGVFDSEKLVNMSKHDYTLEPNVVFTPDNKWIIFRSNMFGKSHVFAVEVAKANAAK